MKLPAGRGIVKVEGSFSTLLALLLGGINSIYLLCLYLYIYIVVKVGIHVFLL